MIEVGQKVVCVNTTPNPGSDTVVIQYLRLLKKGQTYTVRAIHDHPSGITAIILDEIQTPFSDAMGRELGFKIDRFRPLTESDTWAEGLLSEIVKEIEEESLVWVPKS